MKTIYTVGHSNHSLETFSKIINDAHIEYIVDIRSSPYSKFVPHFNKESLEEEFSSKDSIKYLFMGESLGGRPNNEEYYDEDDRALYYLMVKEKYFQKAIRRLLKGSENYNIALLCSCGNYKDCHRRLLVGKVLCEHNIALSHLMPDGTTISETAVKLNDGQLFNEDLLSWKSVKPILRKNY